jgi:Brp/Blh family beta-carotene 15,15'-monooxygenase
MVSSGSCPLVSDAGGGAVDALPSVSLECNALAITALILSIAAALYGIDLGQPSVTIPACGAILLFGLPHGTLDIELLRGGARARSLPRPVLIMLYLALAGTTGLIWVASPIMALTCFLAVAVVHFAEDWRAGTTPLFAHAMALATLTSPALLHRDAVMALFETLTGEAEGAMLAQLLLLVAPVALLAGCVGCADLWRTGHATLAASGAIALGALLLLPPLIGFAIYFCLLHSPAHLRSNIRLASGLSGGRRQAKRKIALIIASLTLAALGITALLFTLQPALNAGDDLMNATFMTLSILTVPHMLMPIMVALIARHSLQLPARHTLRTIL